ncbi:hypothetical protein AB0D54_36180 [Streptomyces xanthophaeus]|uniref:hypothetical protein n=1 Tax=Streptomyces xanthophaeus TaxID=67385 RepID=UPI00341E2930
MLLAWIAELAEIPDDPLVLDPTDRAREVSVNTRAAGGTRRGAVRALPAPGGLGPPPPAGD